jgi:hypothetical protein
MSDKLSNQVAALERQRDALQELCGEIIATIIINRERNTITSVNEAMFTKLMTAWQMRFHAAGCDETGTPWINRVLADATAINAARPDFAQPNLSGQGIVKAGQESTISESALCEAESAAEQRLIEARDARPQCGHIEQRQGNPGVMMACTLPRGHAGDHNHQVLIAQMCNHYTLGDYGA